jgi:hypothetical protein
MQPILVDSSDLQSLILNMQRICPNLISARNAVLSGNYFGEGMLYDIDKFPTYAIGPAMWWISEKPLESQQDDAEKNSRWCLHLFVHPSIRGKVHEILAKLSNDISSMNEPSFLQGGLSCFQLRGRNATLSIQRALKPVTETSGLAFDWDKATSTTHCQAEVPHLVAASVQVSFDGKSNMETLSRSIRNDDALHYIGSYKERIQKLDPTMISAVSPRIGDRRIILVAQCQGDSSLPQNTAVSGWDLFCHPSDANKIFNALVNDGEARSIGLVEESLMRMDSEPPLPVFPRDYPDTPTGLSYWGGDYSDWQLVRNCLEQGWGRVKVGKAKQRKVHNEVSLPIMSWSHISTLPESASSSGTPAVVVRGEFGRPFLNALAGCGRLPLEPNNIGRKRPRRRVRPPSVSVQLERLADEEIEIHENTCDRLLQSLSLPALIRSHIKIDGKGTVAAGGRIVARMFDSEEQNGYEDYLLGNTVAGSFSISRGFAHGIGFVGAARVLHVLSSSDGQIFCVATNRPDGTRQVELRVFVRGSTRGCVERAATLSLLL